MKPKNYKIFYSLPKSKKKGVLFYGNFVLPEIKLIVEYLKVKGFKVSYSVIHSIPKSKTGVVHNVCPSCGGMEIMESDDKVKPYKCGRCGNVYSMGYKFN